MRKGRVILIATLVAGALLSSPAVGTTPEAGTATPAEGLEAGASQSPPETRKLLRQVRRATRLYRDVEAAEAAGYVQASPCEQDPKYGAMGIHFANPALVADGVLDPLRPEVLVYQPTRKGGLRLGAVEYFQVDADQDLATDPDRPWLFDVPFDGPMLGHTPEMPVHYDLHVWLFRHNPAGIFAMWNPRVRCPGPLAMEGNRLSSLLNGS